MLHSVIEQTRTLKGLEKSIGVLCLECCPRYLKCVIQNKAQSESFNLHIIYDAGNSFPACILCH